MGHLEYGFSLVVKALSLGPHHFVLLEKSSPALPMADCQSSEVFTIWMGQFGISEWWLSAI